jgi:hypothetical protein
MLLSSSKTEALYWLLSGMSSFHFEGRTNGGHVFCTRRKNVKRAVECMRKNVVYLPRTSWLESLGEELDLVVRENPDANDGVIDGLIEISKPIPELLQEINLLH